MERLRQKAHAHKHTHTSWQALKQGEKPVYKYHIQHLSLLRTARGKNEWNSSLSGKELLKKKEKLRIETFSLWTTRSTSENTEGILKCSKNSAKWIRIHYRALGSKQQMLKWKQYESNVIWLYLSIGGKILCIFQ